jgi:hypothetical protein
MTRPYESPPDGEGAEAQTWELRVETCRIVLWRGYRAAAFYARPGLDQDVSLGEPSSSFRLRGSGAPQSDAARLAHRELLQRLTAEGWSRTGTGNEWYATELARPVAVPVAADPAAEPEPAPPPQAPPERPRVLEPAPAAVAPAVPPPALRTAPPAVRRKRRQVDEWQVLAATALVLAIFLLGWVAAHASAVGAVPPGPAPQQAPANRE